MAKTAFIGLGVMGYPMAGHKARAGHDVTVYNRTTAKAEKWVTEYGGTMATTPCEAVKNAEIVCACVGNDSDIRSVVYGDDGILAGMSTGAVFIDHTTTSAEVAREFNSAAKKTGLRFLDGPVSGGEAGAINGKLTVMAGGEQVDFDAVAPVVDCYAQAFTLLGPAGSGQICKMINQICIAGVVQGLAEGVAFGTKAGLDMSQVLDVISKGAAQSWQMDNRGETMVKNEFEFGFAVNWMRKDLAIVLDEARRNGARVPVTALVDQFYADVQNRGGGRWDTSSLLRLLND